MTFAWTPEGSRDGVGSIALRDPPTGELPVDRYRWALAARIDRLVRAEEPEDALRLLRIVEQRERLIVDTAVLSHVGLFLVENSNWLNEGAGVPSFPIPAEDLIHEPETLAWLTSAEDTLQSFLSVLYSLND
jgi:hypothetical protein